jgi:3',5'-cyclic AMP phosphodiesterase CpdA
MGRTGAQLAAVLLCAAGLGPAAVASAPAEDFSFAVVGHLRGDVTGESYPRLDELLDDVTRLRPDLLFLTGDLIWGDYNDTPVDGEAITRDWERLDGALARVGVPVYRVPGNHDISDPVTRDIYFARYGRDPIAVAYGGSLFLLLNSTHVPEGDGPAELPRPYTRTQRLRPPELAFLAEQLEHGGDYEHVFVFLHHTLWWEEDTPWWDEVHPLLVRGNVRAVFSGDYGPLKFSHVRRDGIDYLQSAIEGDIHMRILRELPDARLLHYQLDNFLYVTVRGPEVEIDVHPVAVFSSGKYTPDRYHAAHVPWPPSLGQRFKHALGGPLRRSLLAAALLASFALGGGLAWKVARRRG